jgi:hypothetical protein
VDPVLEGSGAASIASLGLRSSSLDSLVLLSLLSSFRRFRSCPSRHSSSRASVKAFSNMMRKELTQIAYL